MAADARVLLARAQTQTLPPLSTINWFENGGLPVQLIIYSSLEFLQKLCVKNAVGA
jgi:hypothetical protein